MSKKGEKKTLNEKVSAFLVWLHFTETISIQIGLGWHVFALGKVIEKKEIWKWRTTWK